MATPEEKMQDELEFEAAYAADEAQAGPAQTDDDAFGLTPNVAEEDDGIPNSPEEATEAEPASEPAAEVQAEAGADDAMDQMHADMAREVQRLKSWEGRLKAREAEIKAGGPPVADGEEAGEPILEGEDEFSLEEVGEDVADKIKGMSPDDAMKMLADDFGDDFTKMLSAVIDAKVAQAGESTSQSVDEIINDIVDTKQRAHFETIVDRHPDFMDVNSSAEFAAYLEAMQEDGRADAKRVIDSGTAREICKMLDGYKASADKSSADKARPVNDSSDDMDAAEGVRSSGMRLPTQPGTSKDYSAAWEEFAD